MEPELYSPVDAEKLLVGFSEVSRLGDAGKALLASRVAKANLHTSSGEKTPVEHIAAITGGSVGEASGLVKLGNAATRSATLGDALRSGALTGQRASLVSGVLDENPNAEAELLEAATHVPLPELRNRCRKARADARDEAGEKRHARRLHTNRRCRTFMDDEGALRLEAAFAPEVGNQVKAVLDRQAEQLRRRARNNGLADGFDALRADALSGLVLSHSTTTTASDTHAGSENHDNHAQGTKHPHTGETIIICDLEALHRGATRPGERCEIPGFGQVPVDVARATLGDNLLRFIVTNGTDLTTIATATRHVPLELRAALLVRDHGCVVPGCSAYAGLELDHWKLDWAKGGETSLEGIACLCKHHHDLRTHRGFQLKGGPGNWSWIPPKHPENFPQRKRRKPRPYSDPPPVASECPGQTPDAHQDSLFSMSVPMRE
jgi:hypothetical protein